MANNEKTKITKEHFKRNWHRYAVAAILLVFALGVFINIGDFSMPDSYCYFEKSYDAEGTQVDTAVTLKLTYNKDENGNSVPLNTVFVHSGILNLPKYTVNILRPYNAGDLQWTYARIRFSYGDAPDGTWYDDKLGELKLSPRSGESEYCMYRWKQAFSGVDLDPRYAYIRISTKEAVYLNEVVFLDKNNERIAAEAVSGTGAAKLLDEPEKFDGKVSASGVFVTDTRLNTIQFDEYYFATTAFNFLHGEGAYLESSHPPLGKLIQAVGIAVFGMNTFGMRFMPALVSILVVFLMYFFGKRLFKGSKVGGVILCFLFSISGMITGLGV